MAQHSGDLTIAVILAAFVLFALVYDRALDYPLILLSAGTFVGLVVLASLGVFVPAAWEHPQAALPPASEADLVMTCGNWGRRQLNMRCDLEAPPWLVLPKLLLLVLGGIGLLIFVSPTRLWRATLLGPLLGLAPPIVAALLDRSVHATWAFANPWFVVALIGLGALAEGLRRARPWIDGLREDLRDPELRATPSGSDIQTALVAMAGFAGSSVATVRGAVRNIRHKGWAALFGMVAMVLAGWLVPATASSPLVLLLFPAAFFSGLAVWTIIEATFVEPGAWD